jgi:hypothetical protein
MQCSADQKQPRRCERSTEIFHASAQRSQVLEEKNCARHSKFTVQSADFAMGDTRWVERHESIARFVETYVPVVHALEELKSSSNHETAEIAHQLLSVVRQGSFVLALYAAEKFFSHTLPLCNTLHKVDCDLSECCSFVTCVLQVFSDICANAEAEFQSLFEASQHMINTAGGADLTMPRTAGHQLGRDITPVVDAAEYHHRSVYLPFIDFLSSELKERFPLHRDLMSSLRNIFCHDTVSASNRRTSPNVLSFIMTFYQALRIFHLR